MNIGYSFISPFIVDTPKILYDPFGPDKTSEGQCDCACGASLSISHRSSIPLPNVSYSFDLGSPFLAVPLSANYYAVLGKNSNPLFSIILHGLLLAIFNKPIHFKIFRNPGIKPGVTKTSNLHWNN